MDLSTRQQKILKIIIGEYIHSDMPIGSNTLLKKHRLGISSATVRSEMAHLEELGYLTQPHTSAGRVPTDRGYRYFVEHLMDNASLSQTEQLTIQHQFHQARLELDQWMRLSATVLASSTQSASLVTSPKVTQCKLKHIELISIQDYVVLLILVLQEGTVKQQIINLDTPHTQDELRAISRQLTELWINGDAPTLSIASTNLSGLAEHIATVVLEMMKRVDSRKTSEMYHAGLLQLLEQNIASGNVMEQIIRVVEERNLIEQLVGQTLTQNGIQIIIGGEGKWDDLSQVSIILSRYGTAEGASGALGVVGPTRMSYRRAVSIVQYMSHLMSNLISDLYGEI